MHMIDFNFENIQVDEEEIKKIAYEIWLETGSEDSVSNYYEAEKKAKFNKMLDISNEVFQKTKMLKATIIPLKEIPIELESEYGFTKLIHIPSTDGVWSMNQHVNSKRYQSGITK